MANRRRFIIRLSGDALDGLGIKWLIWFVVTLQFAGIAYLGFSKYGAYTITTDEYFSDYIKFIILLDPALLSAIFSLIKNRLLWIWSVIALSGILVLIETADVGTTNGWFITYMVICYIVFFISNCMDYDSRFDLSGIGSGSSGSDSICGGMCN